MNELQNMPPVDVITITPQYGCEGNKLAARLASRLHWHLSDDEIVAQVAVALDMSEEEALCYDEHRYNLIDRMLLSMQFATAEAMGGLSHQYSVPIWPLTEERLYHRQLYQEVEALARKGKAVIVGHGAQAILANWPNVLHVRLTAPFSQRAYQVMQVRQLAEDRAREYVRQKDRDLAHYLRSQHQQDINNPLLYNLTVNSYAFDLDGLVDLIYLAYERRACPNEMPDWKKAAS